MRARKPEKVPGTLRVGKRTVRLTSKRDAAFYDTFIEMNDLLYRLTVRADMWELARKARGARYRMGSPTPATLLRRVARWIEGNFTKPLRLGR